MSNKCYKEWGLLNLNNLIVHDGALTLDRGHGNDIFKEAYEEFLGSLSPNEQPIFKRCLSADDLVAEVKNLEVIEESRIRGRGFLARIEAFSDRLQPYFEVINIVIQSHPQCAALVWGALRLVLMVSRLINTFSPCWEVWH